MWLTIAVSVGLLLSAPGAFASSRTALGGELTNLVPESGSAWAVSYPGPSEVSPDNGPLTVGAPVLTPNTLDASQRLNLSVVVTGGDKPYNITWLGLPYGCLTHNQTSFHCSPGTPSGTPTTSQVSVRVVDSMGSDVTSNASPVTINPSPTVAVDISPSSGGVPPFFVNFTAIPTGGTPPFQYNWTFGDGTTSSGAKVEHEYTAVGTFTVTVWGNDSAGGSAKGFAKVHSVGLPSIILSVTPQSTVSPGADVSFTASTYGGLGPYTYTWMALPAFCTPPALPNSTSVTCTDARAGSYSVSVVVTDSLQHSSVASVTLTVSAPTSVWEYVAITFLTVAVVLAAVVVVQLIRTRRDRPPPPPLRPVSTDPSH